MTDKKDTTSAFPPWLAAAYERLASPGGQARRPQALLVHGAPGSGRRLLALRHAAGLLGIAEARLARFAEAEVGGEPGGDIGHADFMFLQPPPGKTSISVEAVRDLIHFLQLRSHQGGARVAVVWPADALTTPAANSLLKTLEEPPAGGFIVLVAASPAALPATVVSRCQRLAVHPPERGAAAAWLRSQAGDADWSFLLDVAGGAPLRALALQRSGFAAQARQLADDLGALEAARETPVAVAQRWSEYDGELVGQWLYWTVAAAVRAAAAGQAAGGPTVSRDRPLQKPGKALTIQALLARLADVEELRRSVSKAVKTDLQYAAVLQRWYG